MSTITPLQLWAAEKLDLPVEKAPQRALSLRQPWAWLVLNGKDVENRDWRSYLTGWVFIHAAKGCTIDEYGIACGHARRILQPEVFAKMPPRLLIQTGGIVGAMKIAPAERTSKSPWFMGIWGIPILDVRPLPFVPCRGMLNYFFPKIETELP